MIYTPEEAAAILEGAGVAGLLSPDALATLRVCYGESHRRYHDWTHALTVLGFVNASRDHITAEAHHQMVLAALFHDAVYGAEGSPANELASIALMRRVTGEHLLAERMIEATAHHAERRWCADQDFIVRIFLDCDMATFGEPRHEVANWNDVNVVAELEGFYAREQVALGRPAFLRGLLGSDVFVTDYFRERFEHTARRNIERALDKYAVAK